MIIRSKLYFVLFYFRGLCKPRKYFYNKNFQIYGKLYLKIGERLHHFSAPPIAKHLPSPLGSSVLFFFFFFFAFAGDEASCYVSDHNLNMHT